MNDLYNVKVGDGVAVTAGNYGYRVEEVTRLTKTQVITAEGGRYRKSDGHTVGAEVWYGSTAFEITETIEVLLAKQRHTESVISVHGSIRMELKRQSSDRGHVDLQVLRGAHAMLVSALSVDDDRE